MYIETTSQGYIHEKKKRIGIDSRYKISLKLNKKYYANRMIILR